MAESYALKNLTHHSGINKTLTGTDKNKGMSIDKFIEELAKCDNENAEPEEERANMGIDRSSFINQTQRSISVAAMDQRATMGLMQGAGFFQHAATDGDGDLSAIRESKAITPVEKSATGR